MPTKFKPTRQRKHKVLARQNQSELEQNTNTIQLNQSKSERDARRQALRDELRAQQQQPKISAKKQKRLDKYIDNKLKKDENLELLKKLAKEKEKYNARGLQSSKNLGKRRFDEFIADTNGSNVPHKVSEIQPKPTNGVVEENDVASEDSFEQEHPNSFKPSNSPVSDDAWLEKKTHITIEGTGLAKPLNLGPDGFPIIPHRTTKKLKTMNDNDDEMRNARNADVAVTPEDNADETWEGFSVDHESRPSTQGNSDEDNVDSEDTGSNTESERDGSTADDDSFSTSDSEASDSRQDFTLAKSDRIKPRPSAFKAWATQQLNQSMNHVPSYEQMQLPELGQEEKAPGVKPAAGFRLGVQIVPSQTPNRAAYNIQVERSSSIQESRQQLPILQREQEIMEAVHNNPIVIIKGDTGSGKTTQLPQFLFEAGYGDRHGPTPGLIGITQPRRVAAVSMAKRVGEELGSHIDKVAHQIRFDTTVSSNTAIKFMTDGILLRELSQDLLLRKYSAIIIDEAHERSVNTDILIGMLSKIVPARLRKTTMNPDPKPLKVIIMSATLNLDDFLNDRLFSIGSKPPVVEAEGRQHRVTTHFALRSRPDYVEEVIEKVKRAHRKLPKGGILVFLTGKNEIRQVLMRLRKEIRQSDYGQTQVQHHRMHISASDLPLEVDDIDFGDERQKSFETNLHDIDIITDDQEADEEFQISDDDSSGVASHDISSTHPSWTQKKDPYDSVHLLPLYSQLPTNEQLRVFEPPPERSRLIVLATNVAETSLTIPGIRFVFDCGRSKERKYNLDTGVQSFEIDYISKASAQQRAGRAGRTGPGHCWRLYSSAVYEQFFPEHAQPEILRIPAETIVLQLKGFKYPKPVSDFPFPTSPSVHVLKGAEKLLRNLGAISGPNGAITDLGKKLSTFPLSPRLGKILVRAMDEPSILSSSIHLVAGLAVGEIFFNESQIDMTPYRGSEDKPYTHEDQMEDDERENRRQEFGRANATLSKQDKTSDAIKLLTAVSMYCDATDKVEFCKQYFLRPKAMSEILQLIAQLRSIIQANHPGIFSAASAPVKRSSSYFKLINSAAASGYTDQVAVRWDIAPNPPVLPTKPRKAIDVPYIPLKPLKSRSNGDLIDNVVFIHPNSVLSKFPTKDLPQYIVYTQLQQAQAHTIGTVKIPKTRMLPLAPLDASTLLQLIRETALIEYGKPVQKTKIEELGGTPKRRICWVTTEVRGGGAGTFAWPLPPSRVKQVMDLKAPTGWRVEEVLA